MRVASDPSGLSAKLKEANDFYTLNPCVSKPGNALGLGLGTWSLGSELGV